MSMINTRDIMETINMISGENLDVRTVTMGISLLDCADPDPKRACEKIYDKITARAARLVEVVEKISSGYGIPIINKRISVTPIAMLLASAPGADPVDYAKALDKAAKAVGVNFIGGFGALVHKGFSAGDERLVEAIPRALAETDVVCSSVNIGSTKTGLNMDAVKKMGQRLRHAGAGCRRDGGGGAFAGTDLPAGRAALPQSPHKLPAGHAGIHARRRALQHDRVLRRLPSEAQALHRGGEPGRRAHACGQEIPRQHGTLPDRICT